MSYTLNKPEKSKDGEAKLLQNLAAIHRAEGEISKTRERGGKERPPLPFTCPPRAVYKIEPIKLTNACLPPKITGFFPEIRLVNFV